MYALAQGLTVLMVAAQVALAANALVKHTALHTKLVPACLAASLVCTANQSALVAASS
jgi:hypothetical protein